MRKNKKVYLVGGGIASLAAAFYFIEDGGIKGRDITMFETSDFLGGSLDGKQIHPSGAYVMRGHQILDSKTFECTFDFLSRIPSIGNPRKSVKQEILEFNDEVKTYTKARLIEKGKVVDAHKLGLSRRNRIDLIRLFFTRENSIYSTQIKEYFSDDFFKTNFWLEFATVFSFQPWHSLVEFRRYLFRSFHALKYYDTMECVMVPKHCYHDSIIKPIVRYLKNKGVNFKNGCLVNNLGFAEKNGRKRISKIFFKNEGTQKHVVPDENDLTLVTLGSMTSKSSFGDNDTAPKIYSRRISPSWSLWDKISKESANFGNPKTFDNHINKSKWASFTITFKDPLFFNLMEELTGNKAGTSGGTTLKNSNWVMSIGLPCQPHFDDQKKDVFVCWGYCLSPDKKGDYIKKKMSSCSGKEILTELCMHLGFGGHLVEIRKNAITIPCMMPYITSQFIARGKNDKPKIIPDGTKNLSFIGQFCDVPRDISFTVEYSVRSAQMAAYSLLGIKKRVPRIYKGCLNIKNIYDAAKTLFR